MATLLDQALERIPARVAARKARSAVLAFAQDYPTPNPTPNPTVAIGALAQRTARALTLGRGNVADFAADVVAEHLKVAEAFAATQVRHAIWLLIGALEAEERTATANGADLALAWLSDRLPELLADVRAACADDDGDRLEALATAMAGLRQAQASLVDAALRPQAGFPEYPAMVLSVGGHVRDLSAVWPEWPDLDRAYSDNFAAGGGRSLLAPPPWPHERLEEPLRPAYDDVEYLRWAATQGDETFWVPSLGELRAAYAAGQEYATARAEDRAQDADALLPSPAPARSGRYGLSRV